MKKFLVAALLFGSVAHAGGVKEIALMAAEDVEYTLNLSNPDYRYKMISQGFAQRPSGVDSAVQTIVTVQNLITGQTKEWTCVTSFVKTPTFFKILSTSCQ